MRSSPTIFFTTLAFMSGSVVASPSQFRPGRRAAADNTVVVNSERSYCLVVPKDAHMNIGDSEFPGGTTVYCSPDARSSPSQGVLPGDFWTDIEYAIGQGSGKYVQLTGCINPDTLDRINSDDAGGQYDSSGGASGTGNPIGSACAGYNHYVEMLEPAGPRACIRCCESADDCPTDLDKSGCPNVIQGNYFGCG